MPDPVTPPPAPHATRVLVKLRPGARLGAAAERADVRPLFEARPGAGKLGADADAVWYAAELPEGGPVAWDAAHARVADQLGVAASDVVFAEPDLAHTVYPDPDPRAGPAGTPFAVGANCQARAQNDDGGQAMGPDGFAWHLRDEFSQLAAARDAVTFSERRTRIAHVDTGYYRHHAARPEHLLTNLERNFVESDGWTGSAEDPDNDKFGLDNSGHGTGTLGILAGGKVDSEGGTYLGGAPHADIVPLRIADRVVLFRTSAFARALDHAMAIGCDVLSMSMGGLPSRAWRETVDRAYLGGLCMVTAAGNNVRGLPTRHLVYPARYGRVVAVCGVMADGRPYSGLDGNTMQGNHGPGGKMGSAMAAWTPNLPWALYGCDAAIRHDGAGTSAATPQVAAAAALWMERWKADLPRDWRRVEAVRKALFDSAAREDAQGRPYDLDRLGRGVLRARAALDVRPWMDLPQTPSEGDSFALLRVLTGIGLVEPTPRERMFDLELAQRWLVNAELYDLVEDPDAAAPDDATLKRIMEAVIEDPGASAALRTHMTARYPVVTGSHPPRTERSEDVVPRVLPACDPAPSLSAPSRRRLRVYSGDPSLSQRLDTVGVNEVTLDLPWEPLEPGPVGEYLSVEDVDAAGREYEGVDLDDRRLLARDGWAPSEGNPQFHQQMVYAVAMKTVDHFERAMGRPLLWRPRPNPDKPSDDSGFVRRLTVRPHALRQANAYYSPTQVALEFGYFEAAPGDARTLVPGSRVYTCLSHDIIAHETTHAVMDGMHRRFSEPSNPDVLALHEAFADIVALMQHFTIREVLEAEIGRTRGDLRLESRLGSLAVQFGQATGRGGGLRDAIGTWVDGVWRRPEPDPSELQRRMTPHGRGGILVAAVFDAFLAIYAERTADLLRIYTGGTGVLPDGALHPDLVRRLASEAAKSADHVLTMCIRALDYLPPVDVTFFEYLRALITADYDLVRSDDHDYRVAFVEAFRRRGIHPSTAGGPPRDVPHTLSVETLRWKGVDRTRQEPEARAEVDAQYADVVKGLKRYADACTYFRDREELFHETRKQRRSLHRKLKKAFAAVPEFAMELGLDPGSSFEVHRLRRAMRVGPQGMVKPQVILAITQSTTVPADEDRGTPAFTFHGGSTLVVDLTVPEVTYRIYKRIDSTERRERTAEYVTDAAADPLRALFLRPQTPEPFAALHSLAEEGL